MCPPKAQKTPEPAAPPPLPEKPIEDPNLQDNIRKQDQQMFGASGTPDLRRSDGTVASTVVPADVGLRM